MTDVGAPEVPAGTGGEGRLYDGPERAAVLLLCLGEEAGGELMREMTEAELRRIGEAMRGLGRVPAADAARIVDAFVEAVAPGGPPRGGDEAARRMLLGVMPESGVDALLAADAPRAGREPWRRLAALGPEAVARGLAGEHPQTVAAVAGLLPPATVAKVLPLLPDGAMAEVVRRIARAEPVPDGVLDEIEAAVAADVLPRAQTDPEAEAHERAADVLSALDERWREVAMAGIAADGADRLAAVRRRMFVFDDMLRVGGRDLARVMRDAGGDAVPKALAGASEAMREHFLAALPARSRGMLAKEIEAAGALPAHEVAEAQGALVAAAKALVASGAVSLLERRAPGVGRRATD